VRIESPSFRLADPHDRAVKEDYQRASMR